MILDLLRNGLSVNLVISFCVRIFCIFCVFPVHEYAHAYAAHKLGDETARLQGRLTLSPMAHIDLFGAIMMFVVGFGYAKPVPVNARNFKNPKKGMAVTALAGPLSNIIMSFLFLVIRNIISVTGSLSTFVNVAGVFCYYAAYINISLAVFNLIPVAPLDGSRIFNIVLPQKYYFKIMQYERYIVWGIFILLFTGILDKPLSFFNNLLLSGLSFAAGLPFMFIK
ncbi:MAG: site-2 protease family protein [Clostridiales bacterium]|nr:site-2 protease family protein [Clostridiales bacterium]